MLRNAETPKAQIDQILNYDNSSAIEFLVFASSARGLGAINPDVVQKLKEETFLLKKNKQKIALQDVTLPAGPGQPIVLRFPRDVNSVPAVSLDDKEIELVTRVGNNSIRSRFKLADMVVGGKLEL